MNKKNESYYDIDCMRCKNKLSQKEARVCNHCSVCFPLISAKWKWAQEESDRIIEQACNFANGKDLEDDR